MAGTDDDPTARPSERERQWTASRTAARLLSNERPVTAGERLATLAASPHAAALEPVDLYGGGIVERLEARIAHLLGKPAALWFPTGTMAQQATLQVWAARRGSRRVAVHPLHHTQLQEEGAFAELSALEAVHPTTERRHPTADELRAIDGPLAAAVVELPMQELGYVLPTWEEYAAFAEAARECGIPLHVDGARLWESRTRFGRSAAEIAAEADSVYVSMYKGVGGISGALVAAPADVIEEARGWRTRYGGNVFQQFPAVVAALDGLDARLDRMDAWVRHAAVVAEGLRRLPELRIEGDLPHINEFWVSCDLPAASINTAVLQHLEATGDRWLHGWWTDGGASVAEATIRDDALSWTADDVAAAGRAVLDRAHSLTA
ncbi:threonine aldolase family protein [Leifsonia virtsii]|uniref:Beta-eliminating lyase-related protein n=1 Tax=Leifsonia virtsii TaxID=3035915 RepID=A0ABT8IVJ5_9MICO|nr:beta-eliminating lyase-related protein [Leifsonia virtsii]MDN4596838.1 beta-eliminating lyase-related protein [Leifsonia virtsii]